MCVKCVEKHLLDAMLYVATEDLTQVKGHTGKKDIYLHRKLTVNNMLAALSLTGDRCVISECIVILAKMILFMVIVFLVKMGLEKFRV